MPYCISMRVGKYSHITYGDSQAIKARIAHLGGSLAYWQDKLARARGGIKSKAGMYAEQSRYTKLQIAELEDALAECT